MDDLKYDVLNEKMDKIDEKIDKILDHSANVDVTLVKQQAQLDYHILRTNILEAEVKPIKDHVHIVDATIKVAGIIIGSGSIILGILKYIKII